MRACSSRITPGDHTIPSAGSAGGARKKKSHLYFNVMAIAVPCPRYPCFAPPADPRDRGPQGAVSTESPVSSLCEPHARQLHRRLAALVSTPRSSGRRPESWPIGRTPPPATRAISLETREPVQMEGGLLEREADHPKHAIPRNEVSTATRSPNAKMTYSYAVQPRLESPKLVRITVAPGALTLCGTTRSVLPTT